MQWWWWSKRDKSKRERCGTGGGSGWQFEALVGQNREGSEKKRQDLR